MEELTLQQKLQLLTPDQILKVEGYIQCLYDLMEDGSINLTTETTPTEEP